MWSWLSSSFLSFSLSVFDNHFWHCLLIFSVLPLFAPWMPFTQSKPTSTSVNINVQHHRLMYVNRINEDYKEYKLFFSWGLCFNIEDENSDMTKIFQTEMSWLQTEHCEDNWHPCHHQNPRLLWVGLSNMEGRTERIMWAKLQRGCSHLDLVAISRFYRENLSSLTVGVK